MFLHNGTQFTLTAAIRSKDFTPQHLDVLENLGLEVQVCSPNRPLRTKERTITPS